MSWNNITPWWLLEMAVEEKKSIQEYYSWLHSDRAKTILPEVVREQALKKIDQSMRALSARTR